MILLEMTGGTGIISIPPRAQRERWSGEASISEIIFAPDNKLLVDIDV